MIDDYTMGGNGSTVMPYYLICDVSSSMQNDIRALREGVCKLHETIASDGLLYDVVYLSVITFSDHAELLLQLGPVIGQHIPEFPSKNLAHSADYGEAFRALATWMTDDYKALRKAGWRVFRPCAYFLACTEPSDRMWRDSFDSTLTESSMGDRHPTFVPFGFGRVSPDILRRLAYPDGTKFYDATSARIEDALQWVLDIITNSVVQSTNKSVASGQEEHVLPEPDPGKNIKCEVATYRCEPESPCTRSADPC